jgi:hypothetical protein
MNIRTLFVAAALAGASALSFAADGAQVAQAATGTEQAKPSQPAASPAAKKTVKKKAAKKAAKPAAKAASAS